MLPDKYGIHEKTVKKADGSYRSLPLLRIYTIICFFLRVPDQGIQLISGLSNALTVFLRAFENQQKLGVKT